MLDTSASLQELITDHYNGKDNIKDIILAFIPLLKPIIHYYRWKYPCARDIESVAHYALTECLQKLRSLENNNIIAYVKSRVRGAILNYLRNDYIVKRPHTEHVIDASSKEPPIRCMTIIPLKPYLPIPIPISPEIENCIYTKPDPGYNEDTILDSLDLSASDKWIAEKKLQGYTMEEIARDLKITHVAVLKRLQVLRERLRNIGIYPTESVPIPSGERVCKQCKRSMTVDCFYKAHGNVYRATCKKCMKKNRDYGEIA